MKKASISQTSKIAEKLGGSTVKWSDKLTAEEANSLLESLENKPKKKYWVTIIPFLIVIAFVGFYYINSNDREPISLNHPVKLAENVSTQKKHHIKKIVVPAISKKAPIAYNKKQVEYASFKTLEILKKLFPASTLVIDKTLHSDNSIPLTVSGTIITDSEKKSILARFFRNNDKTNIELFVDGKKVYSL